MHIGDLIYSLLTLMFIALIVLSPIMKKIFRSAKKASGGQEMSSEDRIYESVDSHRVVERMRERDVDDEKVFEFTEPALTIGNLSAIRADREDVRERVDRLSALKKAVVWKEILDKPVGLR